MACRTSAPETSTEHLGSIGNESLRNTYPFAQTSDSLNPACLLPKKRYVHKNPSDRSWLGRKSPLTLEVFPRKQKNPKPSVKFAEENSSQLCRLC
ncbi:hypothetical protein Pst134EA_007625 [Puccinia striiformis f. sp. tritici]|uniref:hypothetical protein n=1 Tax=Puccinia striiformis f. sp. tritici TaxID=168172 RepID=UPI002008B094|nr:hypothetical protein Pst134EA_007625 [Puccinia striiformis f. sp. tritici]KAH9470361.1 hypothetical protein Pst134EA_007625 [Puccinia striiformis f. sp. tritici]KAI9611034.1 hypothetical protein H4Q26_008881 [Puccinia striiformis f. sp. tritici PST-130]